MGKFTLLKGLIVLAGCLMPALRAQQYMNAAAIEEKVRQEMVAMIAKYDFQDAIDKAVSEELLRMQYENNQKTIEELITQLSIAMKDQQRIVHLWPNAPGNHEMFSHLELKFDLQEGKVTTETAAKDAKGDAYHKHVLDLTTDSSISFTGNDVTHYRPPGEPTIPIEGGIMPAVAPAQPAVAP